MILTIIPLFIIIWSVGTNLIPYFQLYSNILDLTLQSFFLVAINVTINNYVGVPLMVNDTYI